MTKIGEYVLCGCGDCGKVFNEELPILLNSSQIICPKCKSTLISIVDTPKSLAEVPDVLKEMNGLKLLDYFEKLIESGCGKDHHERRDARKEILWRVGRILE